MNNRYIFTALAVVVVIIIAIVAMNQNKGEEDLAGNTNVTANINTDAGQDNTDAAPVNSNTNTAPIPAPIESTQPDGNDVAVFEIAFNGTAFTPSQLTIKNGDVVVFKNESDKSFWPASAPHPQHTNYPEFDPKKAIPSGQTWQFKFTKTGTWNFHDHLTPTAFGKITVQ